MRRHHRTRPRRDERGVALVEFCLVCVLLFTLLLGIICLGLVLSVKQTTTHGVSEGARSAVGYSYSHIQEVAADKTKLADTRAMRERARDATNETVGSFGRVCPPIPADVDATDPGGTEPYAHYSNAMVAARLVSDGIACSFIVTDCPSSTGVAAAYDTYANPDDCITVTVAVDNDTKPIVPPIPLISYMVPKKLVSSATVRLAGGSRCNAAGATTTSPPLCKAP